jgi:hypothetical protein
VCLTSESRLIRRAALQAVVEHVPRFSWDTIGRRLAYVLTDPQYYPSPTQPQASQQSSQSPVNEPQKPDAVMSQSQAEIAVDVAASGALSSPSSPSAASSVSSLKSAAKVAPSPSLFNAMADLARNVEHAAAASANVTAGDGARDSDSQSDTVSNSADSLKVDDDRSVWFDMPVQQRDEMVFVDAATAARVARLTLLPDSKDDEDTSFISPASAAAESHAGSSADSSVRAAESSASGAKVKRRGRGGDGLRSYIVDEIEARVNLIVLRRRRRAEAARVDAKASATAEATAATEQTNAPKDSAGADSMAAKPSSSPSGSASASENPHSLQQRAYEAAATRAALEEQHIASARQFVSMMRALHAQQHPADVDTCRERRLLLLYTQHPVSRFDGLGAVLKTVRGRWSGQGREGKKVEEFLKCK